MNILKLTIFMACAGALVANAQVPPPEPGSPAAPGVEQRVEEIVRVIQPKVEEVARTVERVVSQVGRTLQTEFERGQAHMAQAHPFRPHTAADTHNPLAAWRGGGSQPSRALIVRTTPLEHDEAEALQEDITVMSRILEKNFEGASIGAQAMGIGVWALEGIMGRPARNLYIEGHGVIFMQHASFPLLPGTPSKAERKEKEQTSSAWEEARREIYGPKNSALRLGNQKAAPFDQGKVDHFRDRTIEALANATHMKSIKEDEFITVVITGPKSSDLPGEVELHEVEDGAAMRIELRNVVRRGPGETTTMTIRARKGDIDALAQEKISAAEFRQKVKVATY